MQMHDTQPGIEPTNVNTMYSYCPPPACIYVVETTTPIAALPLALMSST